jgi:Cupin-like domain
VRDWAGLTVQEFTATYGQEPVIFEGLVKRWPAFHKWTRDSIVAAVGAETLVNVRRPLALGSHRQQWAARIPMGVFAREVQTTPGLYLAEWYGDSRGAFLEDIEPVPDFLNDDWLGAIPCDAFSTRRRTPLYWGACGSATDCHFDTSNTVTWNGCVMGTKRWLLFSGRRFPEPTWDRKRAAERLVRSGIATSVNHTSKFAGSGFVTVEGIERYAAGNRDGLPEDLTFYWGDVSGGDLIYVPWRWFHQVHNVTESIAVSRYYVSHENYEAYLTFLRDVSRTATLATRLLIGSGTARTLVGSAPARRVVSRGVGKALFAGALRIAGVAI